MEDLRYDINGTPACPWCSAHLDEEHWRLLDSFGAVARADPSASIKELRHAYFQAYHDRGHVKTEDGAEIDGELAY